MILINGLLLTNLKPLSVLWLKLVVVIVRHVCRFGNKSEEMGFDTVRVEG
jgi:hypothetical protein